MTELRELATGRPVSFEIMGTSKIRTWLCMRATFARGIANIRLVDAVQYDRRRKT